MLSQNEETQTQLSKVSIQNAQNVKKIVKTKSHFASEAFFQVDNEPNNIKCSMKVVAASATRQNIQFNENKENIKVIPNNVVKIKPKRSSSICQQEQNSTQLMKSSSKPKKTTKLKENQKKLQNQSSSVHFKTMKVLTNPRNLLLKPIQNNEIVKCKVVNFSGLFSNNLFISLKGQSKLLITTEKVFKLFGNKILLKTAEPQNIQFMQQSKLSQKFTQPLIGVLQSNFDGSIFNVYQNNDLSNKMELIATIQYQGSLKMSQRPRRVIIYYKDRALPTYITNIREGQNFRDFIKRTGNNESIQIIETVKPNYSVQDQHYCLSFNSKFNVQPSVHNSIFVDRDKRPILKLLKVNKNQYQMNCFPSFTPLLGCAYVISSFTFKLISE